VAEIAGIDLELLRRFSAALGVPYTDPDEPRGTEADLDAARRMKAFRDAGLPAPSTQRRLGRYRVDFFWPDLGFVVETDSLRHHRTTAEQAVDLGRDQAHARSGLRSLRFTHSQVFHRPGHVREVLIDAFRHLSEPGT